MAGVSAAVLLATSPSFLFQLLLPMSDVPVTAWWALSLALMLREGSRAALLSGLAAGAAILTRPNLVPLAVVPGLLLLLPAFRDRAFSGPSARRVLLFAVGVVPPCLFIALLNATFYGSPVAAGYGPFEALYAWKNLVPNLQRYPSWLLRTQTPVVLFAIVAPFVVFRMNRAWVAGLRPMTIALAWLGFIALVFLAYLFHTVNNTWFWLRYVLPGFPALFVLTGVALASPLITLDRGLRLIAMGLVVGALAWQGVAFAVTDGVFRFREGERKSLAIGQHIAAHFPERAVFVSLQHSGSVRYYSGRLTVRFDLIPPEALDTVIEDLRRRDYRPYILLEEWEERTFRNRFAPHSGVGRLDWPEAVRLEHLTQVRIYDPADRNTPLADRPPTNVIR
jgi:4-amino-4-deoxy-L-arabinose transferase-like glycosyltransferase